MADERQVNDVLVYRDSAGFYQERPAPVGGSGNSTTSTGQDLLYTQLTSTQLATAQRLAPPAGAVTAHVQSNGGSAVRYRGDGINPTPDIGMILEPGDAKDFSGDLTRVAFIDQANNAVLDVTYYD